MRHVKPKADLDIAVHLMVVQEPLCKHRRLGADEALHQARLL
eukprot:CAMPEP_0183449600 /NCGR_PEP_ID=MMETSP0370-20130417/110140_1 /TAXON_ID=268820 /ORGANISM="Peridinium aciculiferum, Strain PAER-2" /LENGTH=41 /DNA_ID= /DNA_START= /DNA_END= /DNA_ORIENTATION=